ncbi:hypothetical protein [Acidiluteibacter ferrifornacis]|uniref:Uncharacterized protein n=1 Tax=Acidiluteibacter ferrifornacis TaxID=2692424 RepID=A0A6N9NKA3_9FLAO|nr:hypothetical protein [Acidiluteibacter ferrifornacis]NBG65597.1 hypothetical protein [Acidiluteibacter ferrifornacis]
MKVQEITDKVNKVATDSDYWFVRTDYGKHFENFIDGGYIAISWDYFTLYEFKNLSEEVIKKRIAISEKVDLSDFSGKIKVSGAYNKVQTFINLKKDDVIVIPSRNSDRIAFGRVADDKAYEENSVSTFKKRRKVVWESVKYMDDLNPIFYQVKSNRHAISSINHYAPHIDRVIGNLYKKGDNTHYVLNIEKEENISFDELRQLMDNIEVLVENINTDFKFTDPSNDKFFVKINLQSKGALELIKEGKSLAVLAYLIFLTSCGGLDDEKDAEVKSFINDNRTVLDNTSKIIESLKMDTTALTKPFKDGK